MWAKVAITVIVVVLLAIWLAAVWFVLFSPEPRGIIPKVLFDPSTGQPAK
jgi:hypothetical protein